MTNNIMIESTVVCCYSTHGHRKDVYYTQYVSVLIYFIRHMS